MNCFVSPRPSCLMWKKLQDNLIEEARYKEFLSSTGSQDIPLIKSLMHFQTNKPEIKSCLTEINKLKYGQKILKEADDRDCLVFGDSEDFVDVVNYIMETCYYTREIKKLGWSAFRKIQEFPGVHPSAEPRCMRMFFEHLLEHEGRDYRRMMTLIKKFDDDSVFIFASAYDDFVREIGIEKCLISKKFRAD